MIKLLDLQAITAQHIDEYTQAVQRVIQSGWFLQGEEIKQFEQTYAQYIGTRHCVSVANGLDALYLILRAYEDNIPQFCCKLRNEKRMRFLGW